MPLYAVIFLAVILIAAGGYSLFQERRRKFLQLAAHVAATAAVPNEALQRENEKLRSKLETSAQMLDTLEYPFWRRDAGFNLVYCNHAYTKIRENHADETISAETVELFSKAKELAKKASDLGAPQLIRKHIVIDGARHLFEIHEVPIEGGTVGYAIDVTPQEEIEHSLSQHIAVQNDLMESSTSAIAIYGADMRLRFHNRAFVKLWKLDENLLGQHPAYADILEILREKNLLPEQANFKAFKKASLGLFTSITQKHEEYYYLPDGKVLRVIIIPHELGGLLFSYEDMTDHITLERSYNTLISVKAHTLDNLFEGVAVFGENGRLQLSNPVFAKLWGLEKSLLASEPRLTDILEAMRPLYRFHGRWEDFRQQLIAAVHTRSGCQKQRLERMDGTMLEWACIPLPDGATLLTYTDITDSMRVEQSLRAEKEALQAADRLKSNFLSNVSYEFRSPLTSIKGFSEILLQQIFGEINAKQREYLEGILVSSDRLAGLIDSIMDAASIEAGYVKFDYTDFSLVDALGEVIARVTPELSRRHVSLVMKDKGKPGMIRGDREHLTQAFCTLLRTVATLVESGASLTISAFRDKWGDVTITIENSEHLVPKEKWDTGLELTIARRFIELHGGTVTLITDDTAGTYVLCTLPKEGHTEKPTTTLTGITAV